MLIYAGIDEAGYGPMFGPFVVARTVLAIKDGRVEGEPPSLWELLKEGVCRAPRDKRSRVAVDDSKKLFTPSGGLSHLERGVLAFAHVAGRQPRSLDDLLSQLTSDPNSRSPGLIWYANESGAPQVPTHWTEDQMSITVGHLGRCCEKAGVEVREIDAAVVYEDRFNQIIAATRSKGRCAWQFVARHLWEIWDRFGQHGPWVAVDRQGGRKVYHPLLQILFEGAELKLLDESDDISRYHIRKGSRQMTVSFETESEARHLPIALASMTAKYMRELLMHRFNQFWLMQQPNIKSTAGYVQDGRRFLAEIDAHIDRLGIDRATLIRSR